MTPLHYAAAVGDIGACSVLLEQFQSTLLHARDNLGKTALHHALYWTRVPVAALLLQRGAKVDNDEDTYGNTPLTLIQHVKDKALTRLMQELLQEGFSLEGSLLECLWYRTMQSLSSSFVKPLCASGRDVNSTDDIGLAPIHYAALRRGGAATFVASLLSQQQLDPNIQDRRGETALHYACRAGKVGVIDILLSDKRVLPFVQVSDEIGNIMSYLLIGTKRHILGVVLPKR